MKEFDFYPKGICPQRMIIHINEDETFEDVIFFGGCAGNHKGLNALCKGMKVEEVIKRLKGITCGLKSTSCPAALAQGLEKALEEIRK